MGYSIQKRGKMAINEVEFFKIDFTPRLDTDETIASIDSLSFSGNITVDEQAIITEAYTDAWRSNLAKTIEVAASKAIQVKVTPTSAATYPIVPTITTSAGRIFKPEILLDVVDWIDIESPKPINAGSLEFLSLDFSSRLETSELLSTVVVTDIDSTGTLGISGATQNAADYVDDVRSNSYEEITVLAGKAARWAINPSAVATYNMKVQATSDSGRVCIRRVKQAVR